MHTRPLSAAALIMATAGCDIPICSERLLDACQKARDVSAFIGNEIGQATPNGNAVLGEADALHATGRMSIALRATSSTRAVPTMGNMVVRTDGVVSNSTFTVEASRITTVNADVGVGMFRGIRAHETRVGAVDLLGTATFVPAFGESDLRARPRGLAVGIGLRLGVIGETAMLPAISLSVGSRASPAFSLKSAPIPTMDGGSQTIDLELIRATRTYYRVATAKRIGRLGLTAGFGEDAHRVSASYRVTDVADEAGMAFQSVSGVRSHRRMAFGGASLALGRTTLAFEAGRFGGGQALTSVNTFAGDDARRSRTFVSFGVRIPAGRTHDRGS